MVTPRTFGPIAIAGGLFLAVAIGLFGPTPASGQDPFADAVHQLELGSNGGFGSELLPDIVLGAPRGTGLIQGSFDVLALGGGGEIVLRFDQPFICDGPGVDFTVFENAFHSGGNLDGPIFDELAYIAVSQDGVLYVEFPFDPASAAGLAGRTPVESNPENGIDPTDPAVSGGDSFDLADVGLAWASYVRITDVDGAIPDVGDLPPFLPPPNAGFDLDAIAAVNTCPPQSDDTPTPSATPSATATVPPPSPSATPTTTSTSTATPSATPSATATVPPPSPSASATPTTTSTSTATPTTTPTNTDTATPAPPQDTATPTAAPPSATPTFTHIPPTPTRSPSVVGDLDGDGEVTAADAGLLIGELFDGDGREVDDAGAGSVVSDARSDVNDDRLITVADLVAISARRDR